MISSSATLAGDNSRSPNIVFIVADYMGYSDIGPYGAKDIKTPSLDALAKGGVKFNHHYSAAPTCIPSRAALMSGQYPQKVLQPFAKEKGKGLHANNNALLIQLKDKGYQTALVGKWHLGSEKHFKPNDHGFDYFYGFNDWTLGYHDHKTSAGEPGLYRNDQLIDEEGYLTHLFTQEAVNFIDKNQHTPFFLYLSYNTGLPPYQRPDLPASQWDQGWEPEEASREDYQLMVEAMDTGIGDVLERLKALNLEENTLVIFTYDHGGRHLVDHGPLFHGFGTLWEGGIRVPLIMRWPNTLKADAEFSTPTIAMDITATMLDVAQGNDKTNNLDGVSLLDVIKQPDNYADRSLFWMQRKMKAVRQGDWKYIVDGYTQLLINVSKDSGERDNQFYQHPETVKALKAQLIAWEKSVAPKTTATPAH